MLFEYRVISHDPVQCMNVVELVEKDKIRIEIFSDEALLQLQEKLGEK